MNKFLMSAIIALIFSSSVAAESDIDYGELRERFSEWQVLGEGSNEAGDYEMLGILEGDRWYIRLKHENGETMTGFYDVDCEARSVLQDGSWPETNYRDAAPGNPLRHMIDTVCETF